MIGLVGEARTAGDAKRSADIYDGVMPLPITSSNHRSNPTQQQHQPAEYDHVSCVAARLDWRIQDVNRVKQSAHCRTAPDDGFFHQPVSLWAWTFERRALISN